MNIFGNEIVSQYSGHTIGEFVLKIECNMFIGYFGPEKFFWEHENK